MKSRIELIAKLSRLVRLLHFYDLTTEQHNKLVNMKIELENTIKEL